MDHPCTRSVDSLWLPCSAYLLQRPHRLGLRGWVSARPHASVSCLCSQGHFHHCRMIAGLDPKYKPGPGAQRQDGSPSHASQAETRNLYSGNRHLASPPAVTNPRDSSGGFLSSCYPVLTPESEPNASSWHSWVRIGSSATGLLQRENPASPDKFW